MKIFCLTFILTFLSLTVFANEDVSKCYILDIYSFNKSGNINTPIFNMPQEKVTAYLKENYQKEAKKQISQTVIISKGNNKGTSEIKSLKSHEISDEIKSKLDTTKLKSIGIKSIINLELQKNPDGLALEIDYSQNYLDKFLKKSELPFFKNQKIDNSEDVYIPLYNGESIRTSLLAQLNTVYLLVNGYSTDISTKTRYIHYIFIIIKEIKL